ncbi:MAG: hypothetical protein LBN06_08590 [Prevotellaceae bacterium]|jgi:hypothetical protein|nr:hypothetical protein [Prevotellaceae bacterium]
MIRKLYTLLLVGLCLLPAACSDKNDVIDPDAAAPVIKFPMAQLAVDLNQADNLPVVAVIQSEAGLQRVTLHIETTTGIEEYATVTDFFNPNAYSLTERPSYDAGYRAFIVEATDLLNHTTKATLPVAVTDVIERPVILFSPEQIVYDEMEDNPTIPRTTFRVTSEAGLTHVEMTLVSADGQKVIASVSQDGATEYSFDEMIDYKEGDRGFKVKAEDTYGQITIATLPVIYRTIPVPVVTPAEHTLFAGTDEPTRIPMQISSVRGLQEVVIYRIEQGTETEVLRETMNGEHELDYTPAVMLTDATGQLKVVASDGRNGKEGVTYIKTYVNMEVATVYVGSQVLANTAHALYPEAFGIVSLNDLKSYPVDYAIASEDNGKNVDFKFYCFGGSAVPRLYSMDNTGKDGEFAGSTGKLSAIKVKNQTRFAILTGFDYDHATKASIATILSSTISKAELNPFAVGDIIAFRTGGSSTAGGGRIGVMKVVDMTAPKALVPTNATARVMTLEIKFPKQ